MSENFFIKKQTKLKKDVVVVGGGTAGFVAAIAAARNGADVLIIEEEDYLGGTLTGSMIIRMSSPRNQRISNLEDFPKQESSYEGEQHVFGIFQEFVDKLISVGAAWGEKGKSTMTVLNDSEMAKWVIEQMVKEAGVDVLLYSKVTSLLMSNKRINHLVVDSLTGKIEINTKVVIDTTGDGNVCVAAGAEYEMGRNPDNKVQPLTLYFLIGGVKLDETLKYLEENIDEFGRDYVDSVLKLRKENKPITLTKFKSKMLEAIKNNDYPIPYGASEASLEQFVVNRPIIKNGKIIYDISAFNMDLAYYVDPTNQLELTQAMISMRDQAVKMSKFLRKYIPGYQNSYLLQTAQKIGVREGRRIIGDYILKLDDLLLSKKFDDAIGRSAKNIDIHNVDAGAKSIFLKEIPNWWQIPYRILLPKGVDNLLMAGRCVSSERTANGGLRGAPIAMVMGQAAGTAAALSTKENLSPRKIDVKKLQKTLVSQGALI